MNVLRSILYYSLVARLSATMRLQGKAEESWRSDRNHESHFDIRACHLRRSLRNHWRITKFSINASCKHSTRFVTFRCRDLELNGALLSFPPGWVAEVRSFTELLDYKLRPLCVVELPFSTVFFRKVLPLYLSGSLWPIAFLLVSCTFSPCHIPSCFKVSKVVNRVLPQRFLEVLALQRLISLSCEPFSLTHSNPPPPCAE